MVVTRELPFQAIGLVNTSGGYPVRVTDSKPDTPNPWPTVCLILGCLAAVVVLSALKVETAALLALIPILLSGYLTIQVQAVKHQTNGNTSALLKQVERLSDDLARSTPVIPPQEEPATPHVARGQAVVPPWSSGE